MITRWHCPLRRLCPRRPLQLLLDAANDNHHFPLDSTASLYVAELSKASHQDIVAEDNRRDGHTGGGVSCDEESKTNVKDRFTTHARLV